MRLAVGVVARADLQRLASARRADGHRGRRARRRTRRAWPRGAGVRADLRAELRGGRRGRRRRRRAGRRASSLPGRPRPSGPRRPCWSDSAWPLNANSPKRIRNATSDVHRRPGGDDDDALPHRLACSRRGARRSGGISSAGFIPRDLHVAAERDRPDGVLGLAALDLADQRREEQREALDAHPDRLGGGEVAELVEDDQQREADEGEEPRLTRAPRSARRPAARAARSAS